MSESSVNCPICDLGRTMTLRNSNLRVPPEIVVEDVQSPECWWQGYDLVNGEVVWATRQLAPLSIAHSVTFTAEQIKRQGLQTWARLSIKYDGHGLTWGVICVDLPDQRNRVADAAWDALNLLDCDAKWIVTRPQLRRYLDLFCEGVWDFWRDRPGQPSTASPTVPTPIYGVRVHEL